MPLLLISSTIHLSFILKVQGTYGFYEEESHCWAKKGFGLLLIFNQLKLNPPY